MVIELCDFGMGTNISSFLWVWQAPPPTEDCCQGQIVVRDLSQGLRWHSFGVKGRVQLAPLLRAAATSSGGLS